MQSTRHQGAGRTTYEFREISLPLGTTRDAARSVLTEFAEYGHWELARLRVYPDGRRKAWLKRRVMRVRRT
jgi:hypothetical protein